MIDARVPIALFPVRIETRFSGAQLKVRIFPDEIFADTHEPGLTADERREGAAYVAAIGTADEVERWRSLVTRYTAPRAAWIALAMSRGSTETIDESWTRAARATLPDQWLVRAYTRRHTYTRRGAAIAGPVALTVTPEENADRVPLSDELEIDTALRWTVDYAAAEAIGMAVTIDLAAPDHPDPGNPPDPAAEIELLLVVGVKSSLDPDASAAHVHALFDAHHYTRGLELLAPGTPTNNTAAEPAAFPPNDPAAATSFATERRAPLVTTASSAGTDGKLFARAFGLPLIAPEDVPVVEHVRGADRDGELAAAAMNDALWPATLGYFMEQMMAPQFAADTIAAARQYFVNLVRPGGPLPAFRIGGVPYGLLPVVSLTRYQPVDRFTGALIVLRAQHFIPAVDRAPQLAPDSEDPHGDLLKVLALDASSRALRMQLLLGSDVTTNTARMLGQPAFDDFRGVRDVREFELVTLLESLGLGNTTRIGELDPSATSPRISAPFVVAGRLSEEHGLGGPDGQGLNYITWLADQATANVDALKNDALPGTSRPLLYRVLRHALLVEMDRLAFPTLVATGAVAMHERPESELVGMPAVGGPARLSTYARIERVSALADFHGSIQPYLQRLRVLAALPTAELARRLGEALDACSHRLDAWITSLATARLQAMRESRPIGCHLGAFGWVEHLRPATAEAIPSGFVHAPSAAQASAAAVLRSGYLSRSGNGSAYAIDLSSARVRDALTLVDGVRQGEPLSALLGYRFERDLHERQLEKLIAPLRSHFPLVAGKTPEGSGPTELVAAGNVVDGLALRAAWTEKRAPFSPGNTDLPALTDAQAERFHAALDALDGIVDGVADLLTAESVYQIVRGNPSAAAASLDAMSQGTMPPDPEIVRTPVGGTSFTHRVAVVLDGETIAPAGAWGARTARASAEPHLDEWLGSLFGASSAIGCRVHLPDGSVRDVSLAALHVRPLDVLFLSRTAPSSTGDSEWDRRVLTAADAPRGSLIDYRSSGTIRTFAQTWELARAAGEMLASARALMPADLLPATDASSAPVTATMADALAARASRAIDRIVDAAAALNAALLPVVAQLADPSGPAPTASQLASLRAALSDAAAFGVTGAFAAPSASAEDLASSGQAVASELASRRASILALDVVNPAARLKASVAALHAIFGRELLVLPAFTVAAPAPFDAALASSPTVVGDPDLPEQVLQQVGRIRAGVGRWRSLWIFGRALGVARPSLEVVQQPGGQVWAARAGAAIESGTLSLILHRAQQTPASRAWVGFVVDEWTETIPSARHTTALSFRYEHPIAEAPQAVLLAVPPSPAMTEWDDETLIDTVRETLTLAKIRVVDGPLLESLRPFLPAICLTCNTANEAVSTDFLTTLTAEPTMLSQ